MSKTGLVININYGNGGPGSFFRITGSDFPINEPITVKVNSRIITDTLQADSSGNIDFILSTIEANEGRYHIALQAGLRTTTIQFTIDSAYPLRSQEGEGPVFSIPAGIAYTQFVYLPLVQR